MAVQSLLFDKTRWTAKEAKAWIEKHNYVHPKTHTTDKYIRFRQYAPRKNERYKTVMFGKGIKAIVSFP